jgi:chromosome partitioning protein
VIVVSAALKGGVGKTTTSVYLAALAAASNRRGVALIDTDSQASAAEWVEATEDERLQRFDLVEAPTERLMAKALDKVGPDDVAIVDTPPGHERLTGKALDRADVVIVPTRVGGVETTRAQVVLDMVPEGTPGGLVICSARTFTRDYDEALGRGRRAHLGNRARAGGDRRRARTRAGVRRDRGLPGRLAKGAAGGAFVGAPTSGTPAPRPRRTGPSARALPYPRRGTGPGR